MIGILREREIDDNLGQKYSIHDLETFSDNALLLMLTHVHRARYK
jgi:hypothetical protein